MQRRAFTILLMSGLLLACCVAEAHGPPDNHSPWSLPSTRWTAASSPMPRSSPRERSGAGTETHVMFERFCH
jgi:hypothetical protein